jgi:hypothetical protein
MFSEATIRRNRQSYEQSPASIPDGFDQRWETCEKSGREAPEPETMDSPALRAAMIRLGF